MDKRIPGFLLSSLIGIAAFLAATIPNYSIKISGVLIGLVIGIILSNIITLPKKYEAGIQFSGKRILEIAIILLGFGTSFQAIGMLGWQSLLILVGLIAIVLVITLFLAKRFKGKNTTNLLVGFGTVICGSSAIVAVSDSITKDKQDIGISIAVVNLLGLVAMIVFPLVLHFLPLSDVRMGTLIGGTLQAVGNVAGAGFAMSDEIGNLALTVKLGRVAMLAPALIFFNVLIHRKSSIKEHLKLPYYVWGFIAASIIVSVFTLPENILSYLQTLGKILLTIAMVGIGLNISLKELMRDGRNALGFGIIIFLIQIGVVLGLTIILL